MKLLRGASRQPLPPDAHDDDYDDVLLLPGHQKTETPIEVTRDHPVPLPVALVRGNGVIKPARFLLALGTI